MSRSHGDASQFNKWWLRGWTVILAVAVTYELIAFSFELRGIRDYPTLSTILVTLLGQGGIVIGHGIAVSLLDALTVIAALVLLWHWHDLRGRLENSAHAVRREMQRTWDASGYEEDDEQYDFVTRDKR